MKHMDLFCASPASTATVQHRSRPISRSHLSSSNPKKILSSTPCISELPFDPKLFLNEKSRKSSDKSSDMRRKSSSNVDDLASRPGSSRYLLSDTRIIEILSESDGVKAFVPSHEISAPQVLEAQKNEKSLSLKFSSSRSHSSRMSSDRSLSLKSLSTRSHSNHQVVELRVSIHCKGCEGKVKKHISKMEGVTSFSIDRELKKVTIIGDVTPLGVLASISKVKNAQFWPSPTSSSLSTPKSILITS